MSQFIYQRKDHHPYQCGPIALYNTLMYFGIDYSLDELIRLCGANKITGTSCESFAKCLGTVIRDAPFLQVNELLPTTAAILSALDLGAVVILLYHWDHGHINGEHYVFIERVTKHLKRFKIINASFKRRIAYVTTKQLGSMLTPFQRYSHCFPKLWKLDAR